MLHFITSSIRNKITAVILVAVVSAVVIASIAAGLRQASRQIEARQNEIQGIAAAMATTIAGSVATGRRRQVAATLNAISRIPGLTYAGARNTAGEMLFQHGAGVVVRRGDDRQGATESGGSLSAIYLGTYVTETPIVYGGATVGKLTLIADLSSLRHALIESLLVSLTFGVLAGAIGIGAAMYLLRTITDPIQALTRTMQDVRDTGDFSRSVKRQSRDETGLMVDTFNDMLAHICRRDAELLRHRDELEATVEKRTADLRTAKVVAERANAAKSDFLATMSHEIRTPMNGMLVMAELLSASNLTPRLQRYADVIVKSGHGLLAIINDILDLSKVEAGKLELESIPVDPRRLVDDTLQLFSERAASANLEIAAYVAPDVPRQIIADPVRLGQVLTNLVNNALKFTETGGVLVSVERAGDFAGSNDNNALCFSVRDTGIGIPQDKIATIFDAFAQADQSTTRQFGGTGIGLSISKRLVEAMDGRLSLESTVGAGSTFSFVAPFKTLEDARPLPPRHGPMAVLVALDDGVTREALVRAMRDWQVTIVPDDGDVSDSVDFAVCDVDKLATPLGSSRLDVLPDHVPVIAIGQFGDTRGDNLADEGRVARVLDRPLAVLELAVLLETAVRNPQDLLKSEQPAGPVTAVPSAVPFAGIRVLAADDSPVNREVLAEVLKRLGVQMTSVEDGAAAVEAAKTGGFDLIFMDGSMPRLDGFEATRQIRNWETAQRRTAVPIVALTAHVVGEKGAQWRAAGMSDFVSKPFTLSAIEACLGRWLAGAKPKAAADRSLDRCTRAAKTPAVAALLDPCVLGAVRAMQSPGDDLVRRIVGLYIEHAPATLARLTAGDDALNPEDVAEVAHALKSLSRNIGAIRVGDLADSIETHARNGDGATSAAQLSELDLALTETIEALRSLDDLQAAA